MKRKVLFVVLALLLCATLTFAQEPKWPSLTSSLRQTIPTRTSTSTPVEEYFVYLPVIRGLWGPTPTHTPTPTGTLICNCSGNIYNCSDFATQSAAQACYDYCVSQGYGDVHYLDADSDGVACEGYYYGTATPTSTLIPTETPTETPVLTETPTGTPTFTATPAPTVTVTVTITVAS